MFLELWASLFPWFFGLAIREKTLNSKKGIVPPKLDVPLS
jgi:hypothetical protein